MAMLVVITVFVLYTFWAAREGRDYNFYMPFALAFSLLLLIYLVALVKVKYLCIRISQSSCLNAISSNLMLFFLNTQLHVMTILPATFEWLISTICSGYIVYKTGKKIEVYSSSSSSDHNGSLIVAIDFYSNILNLFFLLLSILESVDQTVSFCKNGNTKYEIIFYVVHCHCHVNYKLNLCLIQFFFFLCVWKFRSKYFEC